MIENNRKAKSGRKHFLSFDKPPCVALVLSDNPDDLKEKIKYAISEGADAIGIQLEHLNKKYRTKEILNNIFETCGNLPIYVTSYRNAESSDLSDEECVNYLLLALECGADLCDVMGDLYHREPIEMTFDSQAIEKQKDLINKIHSAGAEVLMSSHLHTFVSEEEIVRFASAQESRGVDIVKIVSFAENENQLIDDLKIVKRLEKELSKPYLFLANGDCCHLLRQIGPNFGVCMYLCRTDLGKGEQPMIKTVKYLRDNLFKI